MAEDGFEEVGAQGGEDANGGRQGVGGEQYVGQVAHGVRVLRKQFLQLVNDQEELAGALEPEQAVGRGGEAVAAQLVGEFGEAGEPSGLGEVGFQVREQRGGEGREGAAAGRGAHDDDAGAACPQSGGHAGQGQ